MAIFHVSLHLNSREAMSMSMSNSEWYHFCLIKNAEDIHNLIFLN